MTPRRKIEELESLARLEPQMKNIIVEGSLDEVIIRRFLKQCRYNNVGVFKINSIQVPSCLIREGEGGSERGRIRTLARILSASEICQPVFRCISDRDLDAILGLENVVSPELLLLTDFSTIEMYFYDSNLVEQLISDYARKPRIDASATLSQIGNVLAAISCMFGASQSLNLSCHHISVSRCCSYDSLAGLNFDEDEYMYRYFNTASGLKVFDTFVSEVERLRSIAPTDIRVWTRGKDFLALLGYVLRKEGVESKFCTEQSLERGLTMGLDRDYLMNFLLFQTIADWCDSHC